MIYLASPYSHPEQKIMQRRYHQVMRATSILLKGGVYVYSPIVHCHVMANMHNLPTDFEFWKGYNEHMIGCSESLYVFCLDGWDFSKGVAGEMAFAKERELPIVFLTPENIFGR